MKWLAIVNPHADHHLEDDLHLLCRQLGRKLGADCAWTDHPEHAGEIVRDHPRYDGYIAVGGDGTISEVINALPDPTHYLGIIPAGTGNGLAHDLHLANESTALHALERPHFAKFDWLDVRFCQDNVWHERRMISTSGIGYVAGATEISYCHLRRWSQLSHPLGAFLQIFRQERFPAEVRFDEEPAQSVELTTLVVHNTQFIGAFRLFPEAHVDDGRLNVLMGRLSPLDQLREDVNTLLRIHFFHRSSRRQATRFEVNLPRPQTLMMDGTLYHDVSAVQYRLEPAAWTCCTR